MTAASTVPGVAPAARSAGQQAAGAARAAGFKPGCPAPASYLQMQCQSAVVPEGTRQAGGMSPADSSVTGPLAASDLQDAYGIGGSGGAAATNGTGQTVAIVDAYRDPTIGSDLDAYRSGNGLPACDSGCFTVYNQSGAQINPATASSPSTPPDTSSDDEVGWENETALDVEMVSAICPNCKIDLVEANTANGTDLLPAEKTAAGLAKFVSNSWNAGWGSDYPGVSSLDSNVNYPGHAIVFASGDDGYGVAWPATSPLVTSVGGTYLDSPTAGTWTQSVWNYINDADETGATGSGCSAGEPQPSWEPDASDNTAANWCANRTDNDVSAAADAPLGIGVSSSVTDSVDPANDCAPGCGMAGTSVATPIITAMYALAGTPAANTYPASYLYQNPGDLTPITGGNNIVGARYTCETARRYLCDATSPLSSPAGYNGPAGLGVPNGSLTPFTETGTDVVSVDNPGAYDLQTGRPDSLPAIKAYDYVSGGSAKTLAYSATGLPSGLSISPSTGAITGSVSSPANSIVHVTVTDGTASSTVSFRIAAVKPLTTAYHAASGPVRLDVGGMCLDDAGNSSANGNKIQIWKCNGQASQNWSYQPAALPGNPGTVRIHGKCLNVYRSSTANGAKTNLYQCDGKANQQWLIVGIDGELYNPVSGKCLNDPGASTRNGTVPVIWTCNETTRQAWLLPSSPVTSGVSGLCVNDVQDSTKNGTAIVSWACNTKAQQKVQIGFDGTLRINGKCLNAVGNGITDGTKIQLFGCGSGATPDIGSYWTLTGSGTIQNYNSGLCLAIPGNSSANGTRLELEDCYGQPGEVWAVS